MIPLLALAGLFASPQAATSTLSLDEALRYADMNAFAIQMQHILVEKQRQNVKENEGELGPKVNLGGTYTHFDQPTTAQFGQQPVVLTPIFQSQGVASVSLPIDISGALHQLVSASKSNLYAQRETLAADRENVRLTVRTDYYAVLRAEGRVKVTQEANDSDRLRAQDVEARFKQGIVAQVDVLRAQTQLAQSDSDLIAAKSALEQAKQTLNNALARPIETDFSVVEVSNAPAVVLDPKELTLTAEDERHEARAMVQTTNALEQIRRAAERGTLPTLNVTGAYTVNGKPLGLGQRAQTVVGQVALNFPIYDSGVTRAKVREAQQDVDLANVQLKQIRLQISYEVREAVTNYVNALARQKVAEHQVETAKATLKAAQAKLDNGVGILLEVIDAQKDLTVAEQSQINARYDVLQAVADLNWATGSDAFATRLTSHQT